MFCINGQWGHQIARQSSFERSRSVLSCTFGRFRFARSLQYELPLMVATGRLADAGWESMVYLVADVPIYRDELERLKACVYIFFRL